MDTTELTPNQRAGRTRRANTRREVLDATHALLRECSYDDLRVSDIVTAARVGEATIYQVFRHKAGIVAALFLESYAPVESEAERQLSQEAIGTASVVTSYLLQLVRLAEADPNLARAYLRAFLSEVYMREPLPEVLEDLARPGTFCQRLIDRGLRIGDLSRSLAVDGLGELLIVAILQTVLRHGPDEGTAIAQRLVQAIFVGRDDDVLAATPTRRRRKDAQ